MKGWKLNEYIIIACLVFMKIDKMDILKRQGMVEKILKPKLDNIQVSNLDFNNGLVLDDSEAYEFNVNNQLFYSPFGGVTNKKEIWVYKSY